MAVAGAAGTGAAVVATLTGWDCLGASVSVIRTGVGLWVGGWVGLWVGAGVGRWVGAGVGLCVGAGAILTGAGVAGGRFTLTAAISGILRGSNPSWKVPEGTTVLVP